METEIGPTLREARIRHKIDLTEIEGDPMPRLAVPLEWAEVESWLRAQVRELGRAHVGLSS